MSTKLQQASQIVLKITHILYSDEFLNKYWAPTTCQALGLIYGDKDKEPSTDIILTLSRKAVTTVSMSSSRNPIGSPTSYDL